MRTFFILLISTIVSFSTLAQSNSETKDLDHQVFDKNYLQFFKKVKSVKVFEKSNINTPNRDFNQMDFRIVESKNIDHQGRLSSVMYYSYNPEVQHRFFFEYDSAALTSCKKINLENEVLFQWNFNEDTLVSEEIKFSGGKPKYSWKYEYDEQLNLTDVSKVKSSGKVVRRVKRNYDSLDRLVSFRIMKGNGKVKYHGEMTYRDTSDYVLSMVNWKKKKIMDKSEYEYDSLGNLVKTVEYGKKGEFIAQTMFEYDSLNRKTKAAMLGLDKGRPNMIVRFEYDQNDRVKKETVENFLGMIVREIEYEYDGFDQIKFQRVKNNSAHGSNEVLIYNDYDMDGNLLEERIESLHTNHKVVRKHEYEYYSNEEVTMK